jgi:hypothetical protein
LTRLFGFAQLDFAGTLALADGRYVARDEQGERVLVIETLGAPPPARRRRRRPRDTSGEESPSELPFTRVTVIRAFAPFESEEAAEGWLADAIAVDEQVDQLLSDGAELLNKALHVSATASGDHRAQAVSPAHAAAARIGYGSGEQVADSIFTAARRVDPATGTSPRRRREEELRPQQRLAAVLGGREQLDACETLLLRARADLDARRTREAALQLRVGLEALLVELKGAVADPSHDEDMATIESRRHEAGDLANAALNGDVSEAQAHALQELLHLCERVLRRRRVLSS